MSHNPWVVLHRSNDNREFLVNLDGLRRVEAAPDEAYAGATLHWPERSFDVAENVAQLAVLIAAQYGLPPPSCGTWKKPAFSVD